MAQTFLDCNEFTSRFGDDDNMSNQNFVQLMYENVLDRAGENSGVLYWTDAMNNGLTREDVLIQFASSHENVTGAAYLIGLREDNPGYWTLS
jgi:hypothetical protein